MALDTSKPWYLSKGVIGAVIAVVATVLGLLGRPDAAAAVEAETSTLPLIIAQVAAVIGGLIALWGRLTAKERIG